MLSLPLIMYITTGTEILVTDEWFDYELILILVKNSMLNNNHTKTWVYKSTEPKLLTFTVNSVHPLIPSYSKIIQTHQFSPLP